MPCIPFKTDDGMVGFACSRGQRTKKCRCGRPATKLCDYQLRGRLKGRTCDRPLCEHCAHHAEPDTDYCEAHSEMLKDGSR